MRRHYTFSKDALTRQGGCGGMVSVFLIAIILTGLWGLSLL